MGDFSWREVAAIVASLRLLQQALEKDGDGETLPSSIRNILTDDDTLEPITVDEIDELCEAVNA